jgi:tricorn protease
MKYLARSALYLCLTVQICNASPLGPAFLRGPSIHGSKVAFSFANNLWVVSESGGTAQQLTQGNAFDTDPIFSPDGQWIAFTRQAAGNTDVFVIPSAGGTPKRLTYHPAVDQAVGWTPDSKRVLFRSSRSSVAEYNRLFTIDIAGGMPQELPMAMGDDGAFSPDGKKIAYVPVASAFTVWKDYRGGRTTSIRILDLETLRSTEITRQNACNNFSPRWVGNTIYFLSDQKGEVGLFSYNTQNGAVSKVTQDGENDIKSFSAGPSGIVYEQFGGLYFLENGSHSPRKIPVEVSADFPEIRPHMVRMSRYIQNGALSPTGDDAVFESRGEIVAVSTKTGKATNLINTPGIAERMPAWSPDGKWLAYFSDESGEYQLHVRDGASEGPVRRIPLDDSPSYYYSPLWSPDSKHIAYTNKQLQLWYVDIDQRKPVLVDTDRYEGPASMLEPAWSPDGEWLAYAKQLPNKAHAIYVHSLKTGQTEQLTTGVSDAVSPSFDPSGQCLYFAASTNFGPKLGWDQLSGFSKTVSFFIYSMVAADSDLSKCGYKSLAADGDDEKPEASQQPHLPNWIRTQRRTIPLPFPEKNYQRVQAISPGVLLLAEAPPTANWLSQGDEQTLYRASVEDNSLDKLSDAVQAFALSASGKALLVERNNDWRVMFPAEGREATRALTLTKIEIPVDPRLEWKQIYREAWRLARDFYYDPGMHGKNWDAVRKKYEVFTDHLYCRYDVKYLLEQMLGELSTSHFTVRGGDFGEIKTTLVGLLGADYGIRNGHYYFKHIYSAGEWNPNLIAPLDRPGVHVSEGDYLMAVNGGALTATDNIYSFFQNLAYKLVELKICSDDQGQNCRDVYVNPVPDDQPLRYSAWIEHNQNLVDKLSGGRVAYVHLPDTGISGYEAFNRFFLGQSDKEAAILDLRFNGGGIVPDYMMDYLHRSISSYVSPRDGEDLSSPRAAIFGPKVALINEYTESGGEALAWYFREEHMGAVVGKRSWGGFVGRYGNPSLIDGGTLLVPSMGVWSPQGTWQLENYGVPPDLEVDNIVADDRQLAKAIDVVLKEMEKSPQHKVQRPKYPIYRASRP